MRRTAAIATFTLLTGLLSVPPATAAAPSPKPVAKTAATSLTTTFPTPSSVAATATGGTLSGTITDLVTGQPLPGACVDVLTSPWLYYGHTCADQSGHYQIGNFDTGSFRIQASAPGYASSWWRRSTDWLSASVMVFSSTLNQQVANFALAPAGSAGTVSGRITRQDGASAGLATVRLIAADDGSAITTAMTALNGTYEITGVPSGNYYLSVSGSGYATQWAPGKKTQAEATPVVVHGGATTTVDERFLATSPIPALTLGTLSGTVRDPSGTPIAGATVTARITSREVAASTTDAEGHYVIPDVPSTGQYYLGGSATGRATAWFPGDSPLPKGTVLGTNKVTDLVLRPGSGALTGTIRDYDGSAPRFGAIVTISNLDASWIYTRVAWLDGHYEVPNLPAGQYRVKVSPVNRPAQWIPQALTEDRAQLVTITDGVHTEFNETLITPGFIKITLVDDVTGEPVVGACVTFNSPCNYGDEKGVYTSGPFTQDSTVTVSVDHKPYHFGQSLSPIAMSFGHIETRTVRLKPGAVVELPYTLPVGASIPYDMCVRAVRKAPLRPIESESWCAVPGVGRVLTGPFQPGPVQLFFEPPYAGNLGGQWVSTSGGTGDVRQATLLELRTGHITTAPLQHLGIAGGVNGTVTAADGSLVTGYCIYAGYVGFSCDDRTGSYSTAYLGPYAWPIEVRGAFESSLGWAGGAADVAHTSYVQITSGQQTRVDITLPALRSVFVTVTGAPSETLQLDAFDARTGDWESMDGGGYHRAMGLTVNGPVMIRVQSPALAQPCWYASGAGRRSVGYYSASQPQNWLTIVPGVNCFPRQPALILPRR